ncbi:50S ribosomal protein L10 [Candidatus Micrarchaeota archaeon]|nr:50S ribosomal protein L10 [Candidatus Micrarchaeota archaeon]
MKMSEESLKQKKEFVSSLAERIKKFKVIAVADIRNYPDKHLQALRKKLRGKADMIVAKNSLIQRALEKAGKGTELASAMTGPTALILTDMNPFQLYRLVKQGKGKAAAKPGQIAPYDIIIPAGETSLPPGPVLSELKQGGVNAQIKGGKVFIATDSVVAKAGQKITDAASKALQKLGIEPFEIMLNIHAAWEDRLVYKKDVLDVDEEKFLADLRKGASEALNLSMSASYPTKENIKLMLQKAYLNSKSLAVNAEIYEKDVIDVILAKANMQAGALKTKIGA